MTNILDNYQVYIEAIPDAAILLTKNNEIECFNEKAQSYLGLKKKKHRGKVITRVIENPVLAEFLSAENAEEKIKKGTELASPYNKNLILSLLILPYPGGEKLLLARNISKTHRINKMRKDFVANVSHELRTPLTVIKGYLETLETLLHHDKTILLPVKTMQEQSKRMENLVRDLLQLSKLEANADKDVSKKLVPVPEMIKSMVKDAKLFSKEKKQQIEANIDDSLLITGNEDEIQSAFSNLISNAIRYTPVNGAIKINWGKKNNLICFSVRDNGEGIATKHLHRLTERFYRVDKGRSRSEGGTGLGLAIVKHVLNHHHARLEITSEIGKGSSFSCYFNAG